MENLDYKKYDIALNTLYVNLYSLSHDKKVVELRNFVPENKSHLLLLRVADMFKYYQWEVHVDISWFQKLKMRLKGNKIRFKCKKNLESKKDCNTILEDIEQFYEIGLFEKIYKEYYEDKK